MLRCTVLFYAEVAGRMGLFLAFVWLIWAADHHCSRDNRGLRVRMQCVKLQKKKVSISKLPLGFSPVSLVSFDPG